MMEYGGRTKEGWGDMTPEEDNCRKSIRMLYLTHSRGRVEKLWRDVL